MMDDFVEQLGFVGKHKMTGAENVLQMIYIDENDASTASKTAARIK